MVPENKLSIFLWARQTSISLMFLSINFSFINRISLFTTQHLLYCEGKRRGKTFQTKITWSSVNGLIFWWHLDWGVPDHQKDSQEQIIFWKHQCALMDPNIFMKWIGSIIFILNQSGNVFWGHLIFFCGFFYFVHVRKPSYSIFIFKKIPYTEVTESLDRCR